MNFNRNKHGQRTSRESFFSKIRNFWAWADKLGRKYLGHLGYFRPNLVLTEVHIVVPFAYLSSFEWAIERGGTSLHKKVDR